MDRTPMLTPRRAGLFFVSYALGAASLGLLIAWGLSTSLAGGPAPAVASVESTVAVVAGHAAARPAPPASSSSPAATTVVPDHPYFEGLVLERPERFEVLSPAARGLHPVILITIDTLRPDRLGGYGHARDTSPNLDRFASRGVTFTNAYATASWTRPSVASLFTSLYPSTHRAGFGGGLPARLTTLAEVFARAGYTTAGFTGNRMTRSTAGFDRGFETYWEVENPYPRQPTAGVLLDDAAAWITAHAHEALDRPFFVWLFLIDPHDPYAAPGSSLRMWAAAGADVPERPAREYRENLPESSRERMLDFYDGEISYMDRELGKFFATLDDLGVYDAATIAIVSDHGEGFGEHHCYLHAFHMWEEVVRVPFMIRSPVLLGAAGGRSDELVSGIDLAPTLLAAAGLAVPPSFAGVEVWSGLADPGRRIRDFVIVEVDAHGVRRTAIRDERHKLVYHHPVDVEVFANTLGNVGWYPSLALGRARIETYDLLADPGERSPAFGLDGAEASAVLYRRLAETLPRTVPAREVSAGGGAEERRILTNVP